MLADDVLESGRRLRREFGPDAAGRPWEPYELLGRAINASVRFVLDDGATVAVQHVCLGRPSNLLSALSFARPPAPLTWIEWPDLPRKQVFAAYGARVAPLETIPRRIGTLISEHEDKGGFTMVMAWVHDGTPLASVSNAAIQFRQDPDEDPRQLASLLREAREVAANPVSALHRFAGRDAEIEAVARLSMHTWVERSPFSAGMLAELAPVLGPEKIAAMVNTNGEESSDDVGFVLGTLMLLNTRNGVEQEASDFAKLNRARARSNKPPLLDFRTVRIRLSRGAARRAADGSGQPGHTKSGHWQNGHFKRRGDSLFWWNGHWRGDFAKGIRKPVYRLSR